jgi:geranylgeranyl pyrophosphate synthase
LKHRFAYNNSIPDLRLIGKDPCPTLVKEAKIVADERRKTSRKYFESLSTDDEYLNYANTLYLDTPDVGCNGGALVYLITLAGCDNTTLSRLAGALMMHSNLLMRFEDDLVDKDRESQTANPAADFLIQNLSVKIALATLNELCQLLPRKSAATTSLFYHSQIAKLQAAEINDVTLRGRLSSFDDLLENLELKTGSQGELAGGIGSLTGFQGEHEQVLEKALFNVAMSIGILTNDLQDLIHDFINGLPNTIVGLAYDRAPPRNKRWLRRKFGKGDFDSRLLTIIKETRCIPQAIERAQRWINEASELLHSVPPKNTEAMGKVIHFVDRDIPEVVSAFRSIAESQ